MKKKNVIECLMSDTEFGTNEFGFIRRYEDEDPDDEDIRYQSYLKSKGVRARVHDAKVVFENDCE